MFSKECLQAVHTFHLVKAIDSFQNQMVMRSAIDRFNGFCLASFLCERNKRITNNTTDWHEQTNMFTPKRLAKIYKSVTKKKTTGTFYRLCLHSIWLLLRVEDTVHFTKQRRSTSLLSSLLSSFCCRFVFFCCTSAMFSTLRALNDFQ